MRQGLRAGALGRPRRMGWGTHVNPWLIHVNVWQKPLQYCKVISLSTRLGVYPEMGSLDHMVILVLMFLVTAKLFYKVTAPLYSPTYSGQVAYINVKLTFGPSCDYIL